MDSRTKDQNPPTTKAAARQSAGTAGNEFVLVKWDDEAPNKTKMAEEIAHKMAALAPKAWTYADYNEGGRDTANFEQSEGHFGDSYPRLQEVKKKDDPELVLNRWFPISPLV